MSKFLTKDRVIYSFDPNTEPVISINQCEVLTIETMDCFAEQIKSKEDSMDSFDWSRVNPATGPIYIRGVKPGDILRVDILKIDIAENSLMACIPGVGALAEHITEAERTFLKKKDGYLILDTEKGELEIPIKPMVGVIGVTPAHKSIATGIPDAHGGNMDCRLVTEGSSLYFRAELEGGMLACGDLHAAMGDGEVLICGAETSGELTIRAQVVKVPDLPTPLLENAGLYATLASAKTLDEAAALATDMMMDFLVNNAELKTNDAARLMSLVGNLRVCQIVDPLVTMRFEFPKWALDDLGFTQLGS